MRAIIAIDPGLHAGAWAAINHHGEYIACGDMTHDGKVIDTDAVMLDIVRATSLMDREFCVEKVSARPGNGSVSMFNFGMAYMAAIAICQRSRSPTTFVTPKVWKKAFGLSADKKESLQLARDKWPNAPLKRVKDGGRAEALLIAEWLRLELQ